VEVKPLGKKAIAVRKLLTPANLVGSLPGRNARAPAWQEFLNKTAVRMVSSRQVESSLGQSALVPAPHGRECRRMASVPASPNAGRSQLAPGTCELPTRQIPALVGHPNHQGVRSRRYVHLHRTRHRRKSRRHQRRSDFDLKAIEKKKGPGQSREGAVDSRTLSSS